MYRFLLTTIISLLPLSLFAQTNPKQKEIERNLCGIDTLLANKSVFQTFYAVPELNSIDVDDINSWAEELKNSKLSESGLEASSGYDYRFWNHNIVDDSYESGDVINYKHRFFVLLKWNIMQSGLIGRDNFIQRVDILARTKSQEVVNSTLKLIIIESAEQQMANLYSYFNTLVETKVKLYDLLIEMQEELVAKNKATMLSLSDMKIKSANVMRMYKSGVETTNGVIDIENYVANQSIFSGSEYDSLVDSNNTIIQNRLTQELTLNEANNIIYGKEIKVSPHARFSNYGDDNMRSKNVVNVGFTASFPIFTNTKSRRSEVVSRGKLLANEEKIMRRDILCSVDDLLRQLNENLATLGALVESSKHYNEGCALATQYYSDKTMTIQELSQRYIDNLDNNIEIYKLIIEREEIKHTLFKVIYGV